MALRSTQRTRGMTVVTGRAVTPASPDVRVLHEPRLKRPFDVALSALGLVLLSPVWALVTAAIWLEAGRPIFFRQDRYGRGGRKFRVLKFRSMVNDPRRVEVQARRDDPRITRVGLWLRRTALDELPQLWNIFTGDMSFVGPRAQPEKELVRSREGDTEIYVRDVPGFARRQQARPGLTGVAQIYAPREVPHAQKFRYDLVYIRGVEADSRRRAVGASPVDELRILALDLRLIVLSVWITLRGRWEA